jgi:hypothetical protein
MFLTKRKTYLLKPHMTVSTLTIAPAASKPANVPPPQPLPRPVITPGKPALKLGLDVHLEFIMAVAQRDHASPQAPRKFTREQLITQVQKWTSEGLQLFCVQESCGFGFVLHRQLVAAGAQSFLITPIALNGQRKTDKLDARALCLRLSRWVDGNVDELAPIRIPSDKESANAKAHDADSSSTRPFACSPTAVMDKPPSTVISNCRIVGGVRATGKNFPRWIRGCSVFSKSCARSSSRWRHKGRSWKLN